MIAGQGKKKKARTKGAGNKKPAAQNAAGFFVVREGIEPPTHGFSVHCSTD